MKMEVAEDDRTGENPFSSPVKMTSMPGTPLQTLSPERLNQRIPPSPSLPLKLDQSVTRHQHRLSDASDVKARIAYLNSINGSPTRSPSPTKAYHHASSHAAIQRAIVGREEAESALNAMSAQLESAKARERLVAERVESLMDQLQEARSRQRHERQVYEKEMKQAKKSEYKAELAVIKLQEELKDLRNELEGHRARGEHDQSEKEKARQEAFERAYAVAGMTEEIEILKNKLLVVEEERDHAVATATSRMAAEEKLASESQAGKPDNSEVTNPAKRKEPDTLTLPQGPSTIPFIDDMDLDDENCTLEKRHMALRREIRFLKRQREEDQELIHFMNMQCQFQACPCRMAERNGVRFVHDYEYDAKLRARNAKKRKIEDEKPLPRHISWRQKIEMRKNKQVISAQPDSNSEGVAQVTDVDTEGQQPVEVMEQTLKEGFVPAAPLPPATYNADGINGSEHATEVFEAAQIPLPTTGEDTAALEDFTQVIVDPSTATQAIAMPNSQLRRQPAEPVPRLVQSQSAVRLSEDLFDLSPPKRAPPRPSTAMGLISTDSPIRLVPQSPESRYAVDDMPQIFTQSQTTRIALNDTSVTQSTRPHPRSRPDAHSQFRGRSPAIQSIETMIAPSPELPSPASSTIFPITPMPKNSRRQLRNEVTEEDQMTQPHVCTEPIQNMSNMSTTTTTVPLRGDDNTFELAGSQPSSEHSGPAVFLRDTHNVQGTPISREAALAQIRARRDRARSVNMRKAEHDAHPDGERRGAKTPSSVARRGVKIDLGHRLGIAKQGERGRDVSQASAPGRI